MLAETEQRGEKTEGVDNVYEVKKHPPFSWSFSRHKTLTDCPRKYGLHYYESHNGWLRDAAPDARQAYRLKKLLNLPVLFGQAVHEIVETSIKHLLADHEVPSPQKMMEDVRKRLNDSYKDSRDFRELWLDNPKQYKMLFEMYYDGKIEEEKIADYQERIYAVFSNLFRSKSFQDITQFKDQMKFHQSEEFRYIKVYGVKVFVVMDLLYRDVKQGKWIIVDWKTGKESDDDRDQLAVYAYYLMETFDVGLEQIEIRNEYLATGNRRTYTMKEEDIKKMLERMQASLQLMKRYQMDILSNEPVPLEEFRQTEYKNRCRTCNYKEMCNRYE